MKFLVISQRKEAGYKIPASTRENNIKAVKQAVKDGKILDIYQIPGWNKTVTIEEHDNAQEMLDAVGPMLEYLNFEVYPLADFDLSRS
jgi:muconolactone delta-isomerase